MATTRKPKPKAQPAEPIEPIEGTSATGVADVPTSAPPTLVRVERTERTGVGYAPTVRVLRFTAGPDDPLPGLWVELRAFTYPGELNALLSRTYFVDILDFLTPYVCGWNAPGVRLADRVIPAEGTLPERTVRDVVEEILPPRPRRAWTSSPPSRPTTSPRSGRGSEIN